MSNARDLADFADGGIYKPVATGALANGQTVVLNSNGTVQAVSPATSSNSTPTVWRASQTNSTTFDSTNDDAWYDPNSNTVVMVYSDNANSGYGTAIVGTISGTTITFGSPLVFSSTSTSWCRVEKNYSYSDKVVIAWVVSGALYAETFNISGTTITANESFPSSKATGVIKPQMVTSRDSADYDTTLFGLVYITYANSNNFLYGTALGCSTGPYTTSVMAGTPMVFASVSIDANCFLSINPDQQPAMQAIVFANKGATVGGIATTIFFGNYANFGEGTGGLTTIGSEPRISYPQMAYEPSTGKYVVAFDADQFGYADNPMRSYLLTVDAATVTVSGPFVWADRPTFTQISEFTIVGNNGQVVIFYRDVTSPNNAKYVAGTISGSTIYYGQTFTADTSSLPSSNIPISVYDSNNSQAIIFYSDSTDSKYTMIDNAPSTAPNFIGITNEAIADGEAGVVSLRGSINQSVTGLTTQTDYYVQDDGALSTTVSPTPAGKALSPTSILLKGI